MMPLISTVTGGVLSLPSVSYDKQTMLAMPDNRIIIASTAVRKNLVNKEFIKSCTSPPVTLSDEQFWLLDIKVVLRRN
jgi:hypothetical protein